MQLHPLHACFPLVVLLFTAVHLASGNKKSKANSFFSDDSKEQFKDGDPPIYYPPAEDSWSVEFPKTGGGGYPSAEDSSFESSPDKYDEDDDEFYQKSPVNGKKPFDSWGVDSSHRRPNSYSKGPSYGGGGYSANKKPYEEDYDSPVNSNEHHDYDNFDPANYANGYPHKNQKPPSHNSNLGASYNKPDSKYNYDDRYSANHKQYGQSYDVDKSYNDKPYHKSKPYQERPYKERPYSERPHYEKPHNERPHNERPYKPNANRLTCYDREETCTPLNKCPINARFDDYDAIQKCTLPDNKDGVCCPPPELPTPRGEACKHLKDIIFTFFL